MLNVSCFEPDRTLDSTPGTCHKAGQEGEEGGRDLPLKKWGQRRKRGADEY